jgi:hypothetical protein
MGRSAALLGAGVRRAVLGVVALPLGLWCLALVVAGRVPAAAALRLRALRRLAGTEPAAAPSTDRRRWLTFSLLALPLDAVVFVVLGYLWLLLPMNLLYPLRLALFDETAADAWGGPTLAGAWVVHALGGLLVFVVAGLPLAFALTWLQSRLALARLAPARHEAATVG